MAFDDKTDRAGVSAVPLYQQVMDDLKGEIATESPPPERQYLNPRFIHSF